MSEVNQRNAHALDAAVRAERVRIDALLTEVRGLHSVIALMRGEIATLTTLVRVQRSSTGPTERSTP